MVGYYILATRISLEFKESGESWTHYIEQLEQYFLANEVNEAGKKPAIFLSVCGSKTYALARDLLQPVRPAEATFKKIVDALDKHFLPRLSEIVERFNFTAAIARKGKVSGRT